MAEIGTAREMPEGEQGPGIGNLAEHRVTGRAAGGYFGVGSLSSDERRQITVIQGDLERPL